MSIKRVFNADKRMLLGGANETAKRLGIDVMFVRLAFAFSFLVVQWEPTVVAYALVSAFFILAASKQNKVKGGTREAYKPVRGSTHDLRTKLDTNDRRMMAIDQELNSADSERLSREIEELRAKVEAKKAAQADTGEAQGESK